MSIEKAKCWESWQKGFEDGIKFAIELQAGQKILAPVKPKWKWAKLERPPFHQTVLLKFEGKEYPGFLGTECYHYNVPNITGMISIEHAENNGLMWKEIEYGD